MRRIAHDIVIGVDPHKASWTAAVMNSEQHVLAKIRVATSQDGYQQLRTFTAAWPQATWAVEGASGLGAPLTARLLDSGATVIDVPAKLSSRVRMLNRGHSRKTDEADAVSTAAAAMANDTLRPVSLDPAAQALRLLSDRRDDLIGARTLVINRLHATLMHLIPGGAPTSLSAPVVAQLLGSVRPRDQVNRTRRGLARDLLADLRRLDSQISALDKDITQAVRNSGSTLTALFGLDPSSPHESWAASATSTASRAKRTSPPTAAQRRSKPHQATPSGTAFLERRPHSEPRPPHDGHHSGPVPPRRARLLPTQARRREEPQRSHTLPETPPR